MLTLDGDQMPGDGQIPNQVVRQGRTRDPSPGHGKQHKGFVKCRWIMRGDKGTDNL
jgi:hypothetical protein